MSPNTENLSRTASPQDTCDALNRLIGTCYDDIRAQRGAAEVVGDDARRRRLDESVQQRHVFIDELGEFVRELGGTPRSRGSALELARSVFEKLSQRAGGANAGDAYAACARVEAKTEGAYERATSGAPTARLTPP